MSVQKGSNLLHLSSITAIGNVPWKQEKKEQNLCFIDFYHW